MIERKTVEEIHDHICGVYGVDQRLIDEFKNDIINEFAGQPKIENKCIICGKSTNGIDYDYLVHDQLHLGCQLQKELGG